MKQFKSLREANEALAGKSKFLHEVFQQAGEHMDLSKVALLDAFGDTTAKAAEIKRLNVELTEIGKERDEWDELEGYRASAERAYRDSTEPVGGVTHPAADGGARDRQVKTIGQLFVQSQEYQRYKGQRNWPGTVDLPKLDIRAAVFRTGAGWDPQDIRLTRYELSPQRPIAVIDNIPMLPTSESSVVYMEETTFTNNAVETAETTATAAADIIGEAALALTERTRPVEWLPVFIPVTMQQMEDQEGIEAYVDSRLRYMLRARLDLQILQGTGVTPLLLGTNSVSGINTQAKGADPTPDAVYKAFTLIRSSGFAEPSVLFSHPLDWQDVRLLRSADGIYLWGSPSDPGPDRIWGVSVVQTTAALQNTMTAGDYANFAALYTKRGVTLAVSDSHSFYFTRGMLAIRADMRVAMVHFRPLAFATITGV